MESLLLAAFWLAVNTCGEKPNDIRVDIDVKICMEREGYFRNYNKESQYIGYADRSGWTMYRHDPEISICDLPDGSCRLLKRSEMDDFENLGYELLREYNIGSYMLNW